MNILRFIVHAAFFLVICAMVLGTIACTVWVIFAIPYGAYKGIQDARDAHRIEEAIRQTNYESTIHDLENELEKRNNGEHGAIAVLFALLLPLIIGMCAFVVDLGYVYVQKTAVQNAADAAALSLAIDCDTTLAQSLVTGNAQGATETHTCDPGTHTASVHVFILSPAFFGGIYGFTGYSVTADATAIAEEVPANGNGQCVVVQSQCPTVWHARLTA